MAPLKSPCRILAYCFICTPKPSTRKRAQLSQPSLSSQRRKKACTAIPAPYRTTRHLPSFLLQLGQSIKVLDEEEEEDITLNIVEDDNIEAEVT